MRSFSRFLLRCGLYSFIALATPSITVLAQDLNAKLPVDTKITKGKLPNGLTYYIRPNHKPEKKVELRLVVNAGSILEDNDQQGLAHFMEHMNFNGTKNFQKNELVSYLQSIGVEFGADLNAYTSFDETVYILPIPTDKEGNLEKGFQIIEDWAHNALLTDNDIDGERGVVLEESRLGKGAEQRMMDKYLPTLLANSRYAERLPIGKDDILKNFKYDVVRRFYKDWYRPDLQAVVVVGDIDVPTAMKYINKHFAGLKNPANEKKRFLSDVPARTKAEAMVLTDKEATNYQLQLIFPSYKKKEEKTLGDYRANMVHTLMTQMLNRRLNDLARGSNPPFPFAVTSIDGWARGYESFSTFTMFGKEGPEKALNALTAELVRAKKYGFNAGEMELTKKEMLSGIEKIYNERNTTESGNMVDEYVRNFLTDEPIPGIENEYSYYQQMLPGISLEEVNNFAKEAMASNNIFSLVTGPDKADVKLPTGAELVLLTQKGMQQEVKPMEEKQVASSIMDFKPNAGKVVSKTEEKDLGATTYTLSNGIKVTVKSTDFKSDEIVLRGLKKGGTNNYGIEDKYSAQYAPAVISAMGAANFTPTDLEKVIAGKNIKASASFTGIQNNVSASSSVKDLESMFQLLYLKLMHPRTDEALFNAYKEKQITQLQFLTANPQLGFVDTLFTVLYNNNPLAPSPLPKPEHYNAIKLERAMDIYRNEFGTADGYQFFIVGNVSQDAIVPLIETYLGSIPTSNRTPMFRDNGVRPVNGEHKLTVKKGTEKQSLIFGMYDGEVAYSEDLALKIQAVSEVLNIKVTEDLREKLSGIYGGGYFANISQYPYSHYSVGVQLPCGPENVDKLLDASDNIVKNLVAKGPDAKDLEKVKSQWHEQHRDKMKENGYWSSQLEQILFWGKDRKHMLEYDKWVNQLTAKDIQQTTKMLFDGKNKFMAVLYPES